MTAADDPPAWAGLLTDPHALLLAIAPAVREAGPSRWTSCWATPRWP